MSAQVQRGAAIGAVSGLLVGGTMGVLVSNKHLLGSDDSAASGNISLPKGGSIAAGLAIGAAVGAVVGAMVGHRRDEGYEMPEKAAAKAPANAAEPAPPSKDDKQQARAPYLRDL
ncbi:MAG: hypothetical protein ACHQ53_05970 [Polyangiales bacterium]